MAVKPKVSIGAKISQADKDFLIKIAHESDIRLSDIIVSGALKEATKIKKDLEKMNKDK